MTEVEFISSHDKAVFREKLRELYAMSYVVVHYSTTVEGGGYRSPIYTAVLEREKP